MEKIHELSPDEMESISGGAGGEDGLHVLSNFVMRTVCNVVKYDPTAALYLRKTPGGAVIPGTGMDNGESVLVHGSYREDGWYFAYHRPSGRFGYINPNNIG